MRTLSSQPVAGEFVYLEYEGTPIGVLRRKDDTVLGVEFTYAAAWLDSSHAFPLSITLPLQADPHPPELVYPWFLNLLPEGQALQTVGAILKLDELDVLAMVREMGGDLPGALSVRSADQSAKPRYHLLTDSALADAIRRLPERPLLVGENGVHMSLAGAQHKLAVAKYRDGAIGLALDGAPSTHILKPESPNFHASVENEAFCLKLAAAANLPAAKASIHVVENIKFLLVERYDRARAGRAIQRLHQEDLCQATGYLPYQKYEWNAAIKQHGPGIWTCLTVLGRTAKPAANKLAFIDYLIFNMLVGNVDAHAKNYSIIYRPRGEQAMSPLYDVMNGDIYENVTRNMAMKIAGKQRGDHIYGRHWDRLAKENGFSSRGLRKRVERISSAVLMALPKAVKDLDVEMPSFVYAEIASHVNRHCRNMLANLNVEPTAEDDDDDNEEDRPTSTDVEDASVTDDAIVISP